MPKKKKGSITKEMIIEKSLDLFSVKGYFNTSISDIMEATGLTKGGLYAHFKSKEEIWYATYERAVSMWRTIIFSNIRSIDCPVERLSVIIEKHLHEYIGGDTFKCGGFFLNMLLEFSGQNEKIVTHILKGFNRYALLIESWLDEAKQKRLVNETVNSKEVGHFIVTSFYGTTAMYTALKDRAVLQYSVNQLNYFIDSLK